MVHGTTVTLYVSALVALLAIVDCFTKDSYLAASLGIRFVTGIVSCITAQALYVYRRDTMGAVLASLVAVARDLEGVAGPEAQAEMERVARRCRRLQRTWGAYSIFVVSAVLQPTLTTLDLSMPVYPRPEDLPAPQFALGVTYVAQIITGTCCPIAFYTLVGLMVVAQVACAALYHGAASVARTAHGAADLVAFARLHALLGEAAAGLDRLTSDVMVPLLSAVLLLPIQGTYDAVLGQVDSYLMSSFPIILVVFVPMCISGQRLSDASEQVGLSAYCGDWPSEVPRERSLRATVMLRAAKPAQVTCRGLGALGLPACESVLKSWFSYLQMLLNLANGTGPKHRRH
ncbi:hypothetical protein ONE63_005414 [Megalurothrips usitatus]|uniref:Odorant receptor n=1 Tax=Megalurothrips usitatus TaxID=439358 RepID=A0AAV7XVZ4_9NEOP|nr:hypothetical protein ONE63_005414 [Megalurothrips usitatus]